MKLCERVNTGLHPGKTTSTRRCVAAGSSVPSQIRPGALHKTISADQQGPIMGARGQEVSIVIEWNFLAPGLTEQKGHFIKPLQLFTAIFSDVLPDFLKCLLKTQGIRFF